MELTPGARLGPYRILASLGSGAMGTVYLAQDERLDRRVALKMLTAAGADARRRLDKEARAIARLNHANIAALYDVIEQDDTAVLVMEHVDGAPLSTLVTSPPVGVDRAIEIGLQLTAALAYAHQEGIIHRDVKPANVMLTRGGNVKLLDLGVARMTERESAPTTGATETMVGAGTPAYMAPERLQGHSADARTDVYSVGVLLFELLTGRRPYPDSDLLTLTMAIATTPTPHVRERNPNVPRTLDEIVFKAMARSPAARYATAGELHEALLRAKDSQFVVPKGEVARARFPMGAAILLLAVVAIVVAVIWGRTKGSPVGATAASVAVPPVSIAGAETGELRELGSFLQSVVARNLSALPGITIVRTPPPSANGGAAAKQPAETLGYKVTLNLPRTATGNSLEASLLRGDGIRTVWQESDEGDALQLTRFAVGGLTTALERAYADNREIDGTVRERARKLPTDNSEALSIYLRGRALLDTSEDVKTDEQAAALFLAASNFDRFFAYAQAGLSQAYSSRYKHTDDDDPAKPSWLDQARSAAEQAIALDHTCDQALIASAIVRTNSGKESRDSAVEDAKEAVKLTPESDDAHRVFGLALINQSQQEAGLAELQRAIDLRPQHWMNYYALGRNLLIARKYADAVEQLKQVKQHLPDFESTYVNLGYAYVQLENWDLAVGNLVIALKHNSRDRFAINNLATAFYWDKKYTQARKAFQDAVNLDPDNPKLLMNLGDADEALGWEADAKKAYFRAVQKANDKRAAGDSVTEAIAAKCEAKLGLFESAQERASAALASDEKNADVMFKLAVVYALSGQRDKALGWLEQARAQGYSPGLTRDDPDLKSLHNEPRFKALTTSNTR